MKKEFEKIKSSALAEIAAAKDLSALEALENKLIGRKAGELTELMKGLKDLPPEEKKSVGALANETKKEIETALADRKNELRQSGWRENFEKERLDITAPALPKRERGHFHPLSIVQKDLEELFSSIGFMVLDGPELESDYFNFTALNIPADHPARDTQDTFYIKNHPDWLMRTQTSSMQVRAMRKHGAPLRLIVPGVCFRNEATDARHEHTFHQLEGVVIDRGINFGHLKAVLETVAERLYGKGTIVRLRPKFFPFVEPGVNGEVTCYLCRGAGCRLCKKTGWLEIFGAGLIHPNVLREGGIDPKEFQGFAFGFGLTRLAMLKYGIEDIRFFESGDLKFIKQF